MKSMRNNVKKTNCLYISQFCFYDRYKLLPNFLGAIIYLRKEVESMYILWWILFGAFVGWIASILTHNNAKMGIIGNIVVGLIGSVIGGIIASLAGYASFSSFSFWGFVFAILGSVLLLSFLNWIRGRR